MKFARSCTGILFFFVSFAHTAAAVAAHPEISTRFRYLPGAEPLTTDRVLVLDPDQSNPHRQRFVLQRQTQLENLTTIELPNRRFGVRAAALVSISKSYVRGPGPWYQTKEDFPCTPQPVSWFATEEGTRKAAVEAAALWEAELSEARMKLEWVLGRVAEATPQLALQIANALFESWLRVVSEEWRQKVAAKGRLAEWRFYRDLTGNACKNQVASGNQKNTRRDWEEMMEPVPGAGEPKVLTRAPSRRWGGAFTVRVELQVGAKKLNGQFLIDSAARTSMVSPSWLRQQGVLPVELESTGTLIEKVRWGSDRRLKRDGALAKKVKIVSAEITGYELRIREFLLHDTTQLFLSSDSSGSCCAGVLGTDFLRRVVAEFKPSEPLSEVIFFSPAGFFPKAGYPEKPENFEWVEVATTQFGEAASACHVKTADKDLLGVVWNSAEEVPLSMTAGIRKSAKTAQSAKWSLECKTGVLASGMKAASSPYSTDRRPGIAADIGIPVLARGPFILDLPHGRIWFAKTTKRKPDPGSSPVPEISGR